MKKLHKEVVLKQKGFPKDIFGIFLKKLMLRISILFIIALLSIPCIGQKLDSFIQFDYLSAATDIQVDPNGNLILLGHRTCATSNGCYHRDGFLSKYDQAGNLLWTKDLDYDSSPTVIMALDPSGNIYINLYDDLYRLMKLDNNGVLIWERQIEDPLGINFNIQPGSIHADEEHLFLGFSYFGKNYFELDSIDHNKDGRLCMIKYDLDGSPQWLKTMNASSGGNVTAIDTDQSDNIFFSINSISIIEVDTFSLFAFGSIAAFSRLNSDGSTQWLQKFGDLDGGQKCNSLLLDKQGNILVAGNLFGAPTVLKYDKYGKEIWQHSTPVQFVNRTGNGTWNTIYVNEFGTIYTAGSLVGELDFGDFTLTGTDEFGGDHLFASFNSTGEILYVESISGNEKDELISITGVQDKIFIAGYNGGITGSQSIPYENYLSILKYEEENFSFSESDEAWQIFPNPNPGQFCIYFSHEPSSEIQVQVHNMLGQLLYEKHYSNLSEYSPLITVNLSSKIPGHYVLTIKNGKDNRSVLFAAY